MGDSVVRNSILFEGVERSGSLLSKRPRVHNYEDGGNSSNLVQHEIYTNESTSTLVNVRMSMEDFTAGINHSGGRLTRTDNCSNIPVTDGTIANDPSAHTHCSGIVD
ncbi:hypothetical protein Tco_0807102 [Tanacetum coccineum]